MLVLVLVFMFVSVLVLLLVVRTGRFADSANRARFSLTWRFISASVAYFVHRSLDGAFRIQLGG